MGNNARKFRAVRIAEPGQMPGYRDDEIQYHRLNDEIRQLEASKMSTGDAVAAVAVSNTSVSLLTSAARTATTDSLPQVNDYYSRLLLIVDVSAQAGGSVTPKLQIQDSVSLNWVTVWTANAPLTSVGTYTYYFANAGGGGSFTETAGFGFPAKNWRLQMAHNNGSGITYSASGEEMN